MVSEMEGCFPSSLPGEVCHLCVLLAVAGLGRREHEGTGSLLFAVLVLFCPSHEGLQSPAASQWLPSLCPLPPREEKQMCGIVMVCALQVGATFFK